MNDPLMKCAWAVFYLLAVAVAWNTLAASDWRFLTENGRKLLAMAGLCLYVIILYEKHRRKNG